MKLAHKKGKDGDVDTQSKMINALKKLIMLFILTQIIS